MDRKTKETVFHPIVVGKVLNKRYAFYRYIMQKMVANNE